jgi:hypothetical protein
MDPHFNTSGICQCRHVIQVDHRYHTAEYCADPENSAVRVAFPTRHFRSSRKADKLDRRSESEKEAPIVLGRVVPSPSLTLRNSSGGLQLGDTKFPSSHRFS